MRCWASQRRPTSRSTPCPSRDNLLKAWREVYRDEPPPEVVESFEGGAAMTAEVNNTEEARASSTNPVEMRGIEKGFAGVPVLRGVDPGPR